MKKLHTTQQHSRQSGMISIMVTMLMMIVISLIVLGFAQVSRRELNQSLDRQLSAQAFFAAESAVNDVRFAIQPMIEAGINIPEKDECKTDGSSPDPYDDFQPNIDLANKVSYTCLLVSAKTPNLSAPVDPTGASAKMNMESDGANFGSMTINWRANAPVTSTTGCSTTVPATTATSGPFRRGNNWPCGWGVLRVDLVPTETLTTGALAAGQNTFFLYPTTNAPTTPVSLSTTNGGVVAMRCRTTTNCDVTLSDMSAGSYAIKLTAVYKPGVFDITARDAGGSRITFQNGQVVVDATGRANDVLRRIQVRLPARTNVQTPDYAIESASSVCKRFQFTPTTFSNAPGISGQDRNNPMCRPFDVPPIECAVQNDIMFAMDTSISMQNDYSVGAGITREAKAKQVLRALIPRLQLGRTNHIGFLGFSGDDPGPPAANNRITTFFPVTDNDATGLDLKIRDAPSKYGTIFTPAMRRAQLMLTQGDSRNNTTPPTLKYLVFLSDGEVADETRANINAVANDLKNNLGIVIYTVSIGPPQDNANDFVLLKDMASGSGANKKYFDGRTPALLDNVIDQIRDELTCQTPIRNP